MKTTTKHKPISHDTAEIRLIATTAQEVAFVRTLVIQEMPDILKIDWEPSERCRRGWRMRGMMRPRKEQAKRKRAWSH